MTTPLPRRTIPQPITQPARRPPAPLPETPVESPKGGRPLILPGLLNCRGCTLANGRLRVVPGWGSFPAKLMIVAQSPGDEEDRLGKPLIGRSGQLLDALLSECRINITDYYKTNINHCHPPNNRKATVKEVNACRPWLDQEVEAVDPDIILCLGDTAYRAFLPEERTGISQIRGSVFTRKIAGRRRYVIPTIHPAFVLRNMAANRPLLKADLQKVRKLLDGEAVSSAIPFRKTPATWSEILEVVYDPDRRPFGFDLETDSLDRNSDILGVGVCNTPGDGRYHPFVDSEEACERMSELRSALEDPTRPKIVSNAKFERHVCRGCHSCDDAHHLDARYGIELRGFFDTLIEAWLVGTVPLGLKDAMHHLFGIEMIRIDEFYKQGFKKKDRHGVYQVDMAEAQSEDILAVAEYAAQDPDASLRVHNALVPILRERGQWELYTELELPITEVIVEMEHNGILFNPQPARDVAPTLLTKMGLQIQELNQLAGVDFNPMSPPQCAELLYGDKDSHPYKLPIPPDFDPRKSNSAYPPVDRITLGQHLDNPLVRGILSARAQNKLYSNYIVGLEKWVERDGRIHTDIKQTGAGTGRVSSSKPNMQNISSRARDDVDVGIDIHVVRECFVAPVGKLISAPDISQIEMRMAAHLSGDSEMIRIITEGADLHNNSAYKMYKTNAEEIAAGRFSEDEWKNMRYLAKTIGFGCLYGLTPTGLLLRTPTLKLSIDDAKGFIDGFYQAYPGLRQWQLDTINFVREHGYAESILGRRRYFPDIRANNPKFRKDAEREAINMPIQGSAADYFKRCLLLVKKFIDDANLQTRLILQVHDEIVLEGPESEIDILEREIPPLMANAIPLKVPVKIDFEFGHSWGKLYDRKKWDALHANP